MDTAHSPCARVPGLLRESLSWSLARIAHAVSTAQNEALAPLGLTLRTYAVLAMVGGGTVRSQLEIAGGVGLDKTTLVATLDDLERRGFLTRTPDPHDRRARIVSITCEGEKLLAGAAGAVRALEAEIAAAMPAEQAQQLREGLNALYSGPLAAHFDRAGSCL